MGAWGVARGAAESADAEVLQEILHRYHAIGRPEAIEPAFQAILRLADEVFAIEAADVRRAKEILLSSRKVSSRDAVHAAVMQRHRVSRILSFDRGFDGVPGLARLH